MTICHARHNIMALKFFSFLDALYPMSILAIVWFYHVTGSYTTAAMMFGIQTISQAFLEIPTGVLSDKYSRVFNLQLSAFFWFCCYLLSALAGVMPYGTVMLIISAIIGGLAGSLNSGTKEALIYETLADEKQQSNFDIVFSRIMFWEQIGAMGGAFLATATMFFFNIYTLTWVTAFIGLLFFISSFLLTEPKSRQKTDTTSFKLFWNACRNIWHDKKLRALIGIKMLQGQTGYHMEGAYFAGLIPTSLIPLARLFRQFTGAIGFYLSAFIRKFGFLKILIYSSFGSFLFKVTGLGLNCICTPFINSATNLFYGFNSTAYNALLQEKYTNEQRATMQNIQSLSSSIAGGILLIIFGRIADTYSVLTAMWGTAILDLIVVTAYWQLFKKTSTKGAKK